MTEGYVASASADWDVIAKLTERERDCLRLLAGGLRTKEIAIEFGISPETVKQHLASARKKMGMSSSVAAARTFQKYQQNYKDLASVSSAAALVDGLPIYPPNRVSPSLDLAQVHPVDAMNSSGRDWRRWLGPLGWLIPAQRGAANELRLVQRVILLLLLPLAIMLVTVGALSSYETLGRLLTRIVG